MVKDNVDMQASQEVSSGAGQPGGVLLRVTVASISWRTYSRYFFSVFRVNFTGATCPREGYGSLGDKAAMAICRSNGSALPVLRRVERGGANRVATLTKKIREDFATAKAKLASIMKESHMVLHPPPSRRSKCLEALKAANPAIKIGLIGKEGFEQKRVFGLSGERIASLLGPTATPVEAKTLDVGAPES